MVKPATVANEELTERLRTRKQKLRLVQTDAQPDSVSHSKSAEPQKPDVADDLDDMWDNVPV